MSGAVSLFWSPFHSPQAVDLSGLLVARQAAPVVGVRRGAFLSVWLPFLVSEAAPACSAVPCTGLGGATMTVPVGAGVPSVATRAVLHPAGVVVVPAAETAFPLAGTPRQARVTAA